jgi:DNA-binding transcriptional MerR regulator
VTSRAAAPASKRAQRRSSARKGAEDPLVPDKLYFRIGEVARICRVPAYVLRFWESEFAQLRPNKSSTGQRMYRRSEVECALRIRQLLYSEGFTIPGARQQLLNERKKQTALPFAAPASPDGVRRLRQGLRELLAMLERTPKK